MLTVTIVHRPGDAEQVALVRRVIDELNASLPTPLEMAAMPPEEAPVQFGRIAPPAVICGDLVLTAGAPIVASRLRQLLLRAMQQAGVEADVPDDGPEHPFRVVTEGALAHVEAEPYMTTEGCEPLLLFWHVEEGEAVVEGQELAEVETAKAVFVLECPATGVLQAIHAPAGAPVTPGLRLATIIVSDAASA